MSSLVAMVILLHTIFLFHICAGQMLSTCLSPIYNQTCDIKCETADQTKVISFYRFPDYVNKLGQCSGSTCKIINDSLNNMYSISTTGPTTTTLQINNLSWDDKVTWRCDYGLTQNTTVLGFAKYPDEIEYSGVSNNSVIPTGTKMKITMKCLYTEIPTNVKLNYVRNGTTILASSVSCTDTTSTCTNNNFVSKLCTATVEVGSIVRCDGNYSLEITTSVLENVEKADSVYTGIQIKCKSEESSSSDTLKTVSIILGSVSGVGVVAGGSILVKKQSEKKTGKANGKENSEGDNSKNKTDKPVPDVAGRGAAAPNRAAVKPASGPSAADPESDGAAPHSAAVKAVHSINEENSKNNETSNVEQKGKNTKTEEIKDNHTDDKKHQEKPNGSPFNFAVGERALPVRLEPIKPKKEKRKRKKKDAEENINN